MYNFNFPETPPIVWEHRQKPTFPPHQKPPRFSWSVMKCSVAPSAWKIPWIRRARRGWTAVGLRRWAWWLMMMMMMMIEDLVLQGENGKPAVDCCLLKVWPRWSLDFFHSILSDFWCCSAWPATRHWVCPLKMSWISKPKPPTKWQEKKVKTITRHLNRASNAERNATQHGLQPFTDDSVVTRSYFFWVPKAYDFDHINLWHKIMLQTTVKNKITMSTNKNQWKT